ncbi:kinetochore protein Mis12 [Schizosaccharomyces japonicus yFS275]|uniref:Kinetochore protein Mis12 n=1 Tax=Schizosaccharomyces japonicus (strain yFS275 / FY16936) TaxID=402676 RepID=B6K3N0_SCHJY|nr:kinetochore protein Mis12 [Schizosaccharomyces japonicus yFS275]EEB08087.1 kinetochore protein Mis12 [Schizosaccharomyces japonicus yFS275]
MLVQLLEFTPLSFIDDVINITNQLLYKAVNAVDRFFSSLPSGTTSATEIEEGLHKFEILFENIVDRYYDRFELFALRNIFMIPQELTGHFRMQGQDVDYTVTQVQNTQLDQKIVQVKNTLTDRLRKRNRLQAQLQAIRQRKTEIRERIQRLTELDATFRSQKVTLPDSTDFLMDQLPILQKAIESQPTESIKLDSSVLDDRLSYFDKRLQTVLSPTERQIGFWERELQRLPFDASVNEVQSLEKTLATLD